MKYYCVFYFPENAIEIKEKDSKLIPPRENCNPAYVSCKGEDGTRCLWLIPCWKLSSIGDHCTGCDSIYQCVFEIE